MIGVLNGEFLSCIIVAGEQKLMRRPKIIGRSERIGGVERSDAFNNDGIIRRKQPLEYLYGSANSIFHVEPTRLCADKISHPLRVHVAVSCDGFDQVRDITLSAFASTHVQCHGKRRGTAVVGCLLLIGWGGHEGL